jgi:MFS family permease
MHAVEDRKYERLLVTVMFAAWGSVFLDRMAMLYLAPFVAPDLHLSHEDVGLLASATSVTWAVSSLLFGALSDRFGRKIILLPMVFVFSVLSAVSGLATNLTQLLFARAAMGAAEGPCWSVMNALVEESSHPSRRGRNMGIVVSAAAAIGLAVAPVLTTQVAAHYGWRASFMVVGIPGILSGLLIWAFIREPKRDGDTAVADAHPVAGHGHHGKITWGDFLTLFRYRNIWLACLGATGFIAWLIIHSVFGPLYMTTVAGQTGSGAGFLMGAAGVGSLIIGMSGATLSDKFGRRKVIMSMAGLCMLLPLLILYTPLYQYPWLLAVLLGCTQGGQAIAALLLALVPAESVPRTMAASAIGLVNLTAEILGGTLAPVLAGRLGSIWGLGAPLIMASCGAVLVLVSAYFLTETRGAEID